MGQKVIILGANGRFGRAVVKAFHSADWDVSAFVRKRTHADIPSDVTVITGDAYDQTELAKACKGHETIVNAINPLYKDWEHSLPILTINVIAAARSADATVMIPGNIYNYGNELPTTLNENTPWVPNTKKGRLRIEMENAYRDAGRIGVQTIVLRGGDFIEGKTTGNWFEDHIINKIAAGKITYPGPLDQKHTWAYLPDMAKAMVQLAEKRNQIDGYEEFIFENLNLTGAELVRSLETAIGKKLKTSKFNWPLVHFAALFSAQIREVIEMRYLWQRPHSMDGSKLNSFLPEFKLTSPEDVMKKCIAQMSKP